jgi:hypothetical protein
MMMMIMMIMSKQFIYMPGYTDGKRQQKKSKKKPPFALVLVFLALMHATTKID